MASGCDLSTKSWAEQALGVPGASRSVWEPWLELSLAYNRGTAFSVLPQLGDLRWLFVLLSIAICGLLLGVALSTHPIRRLELFALGLTAGGALGNGYDRAFRLAPTGETGVVDFIKVNLSATYSWPTFNIADVWLVIGPVLLLWAGWTRRRLPPRPTAPPPRPA